MALSDPETPITTTATYINLRTGRTYDATFEGKSTPHVIQCPDMEYATVDGTDTGALSDYLHAAMVREDRLGEPYPASGYESSAVITPQTYLQTLAVYGRLAHGKSGAKARELQLLVRSKKSEYAPTTTSVPAPANK